MMFAACGMTDNAGLRMLMENAENGPHGKPRNRSVYADKIGKLLLPGGKHVCKFTMHHNTYEMRTCWMVAVRPETEGAEVMGDGDLAMIEIWLDVAHDVLDKHMAPIPAADRA